MPRFTAAFLVAFAAPVAAFAQSPSRPVHGNLRDHVVTVTDEADKPMFELMLTGASLNGSTIVLRGTLKTAGGTKPATAAIVGTLAKDPSPEYAANRARRIAAQRGTSASAASGKTADQKPGGPATTTEAAGQIGQLSQSTQSTARDTQPPVPAGGETPKPETNTPETGTSGCDMLFLRVDDSGKAVQVNVALARLDNERGLEVSRRVCRVVMALEANDGSAAARVAELDRALGGSK